ncbi:Alpha/beta hydrolase-3 [Melia azedarach]|uniref:Alpha/beta hydrolase-3 n=1 Tax=Melia azedarach TaxID=155640 RepID=A0ACC1YUR0_MELAZ|nr:Alpha/beta hydrolase-3 [Melia azedarach]
MAKFDSYGHLGIVLNANGSITRKRSFPRVEDNPEPIQGNPIVSKDVILNEQNKTTMRIFRPVKLPSNDNTVARLPIILYFHGGGFVLYTGSDAMCHKSCTQMASEIPSITISVDYRLAPEHRIPACYEDALDALLWVKRQALDSQGEEWLRNYGDFSRCYLAGRGSGGNIVYNAAIKALDMDLDLGPAKIAGLVFNQPMFGGVQRTKSEINYAADNLMPLPSLDTLWDLSLPEGTDRDHRYCNPIIDIPHKNKIGSLPRSLIIGFGMDPLFDRQQDFVQMLALNGVQVEAQFDETGFHCVDIVDNRRALAVLKITKDFII